MKLADGELVIGTKHVDRQSNSTLTLPFRLLVCTSSAAQLLSLFLACQSLAVEQVDCVAPTHTCNSVAQAYAVFALGASKAGLVLTALADFVTQKDDNSMKLLFTFKTGSVALRKLQDETTS